jgi:hypothetical protein
MRDLVGGSGIDDYFFAVFLVPLTPFFIQIFGLNVGNNQIPQVDPYWTLNY